MHTFEEIMNGNTFVFNRKHWLPLVERALRRNDCPNTLLNHVQAVLRAHEKSMFKFDKITCKTQIIHGTEDVVLPLEHGRALANYIPQAEFFIIEGMGHHLNPAIFQTVIKHLVSIQKRKS